MKKYLLSAFLLFTIINVNAQVLSVIGYQERIPENNAELRCKGITLRKTMTIIAVEGNHNGFWIMYNNKPEKAFWGVNHAEKAVGEKLKAGTYHFYPNLKPDSDSAYVEIKLK